MATGKKKKGGRTLILLALVLILGLVAIFVLFRDQLLPTNSTTGEVPQTAEEETFEAAPVSTTADIYVLQQPLARGQVIEEGHLLKVAYPRERLIEGLFITNPADAIGKRAMFELEAGMPLTFAMISGSTEGSYASFQIPKGYVAVTIPLAEEMGITSVAYAVRAGDHVNVISSMLFVDLDQEWQTILPNVVAPVYAPALSFTPPTDPENPEPTIPNYNVPVTAEVQPVEGLPYIGRTELWAGIDASGQINTNAYVIPAEEQRPRLVSQTLIQDAIVLWVGEYPLDDEKAVLNLEEPTDFTQQTVPANGEEAPVADEVVKPKVITLVVSPQDAVTLNYMILSRANLSLALRSAGDSQRINTESVTLQFIMQQYNIPLPSPLAYGLQPGITELSYYDELPTYVEP